MNSDPTKPPIKSGNASEDFERLIESILKCNCKRDITTEEIKSIYRSQKISRIHEFYPHINAAIKKYNINTCLRKAHFLAQVGHESGQLTFTSEKLNKGISESQVYDGYKGRGLIQLTWKESYIKYGNYIKKNLLGADKLRLEKPDLASDSAGWYWSKSHSYDLNNYADKNDLIRISILINGGFNGYADRLSLLQKASQALRLTTCDNIILETNFENFLLQDSDSYNKSRDCLAWGLWHDPHSKMKGTKKSEQEAKIGYERFISLLEKDPTQLGKKAFGHKFSEWKTIIKGKLK